MTAQQKESTYKWVITLLVPIAISAVSWLMLTSADNSEQRKQGEINTKDIELIKQVLDKKADEKDLDRVYDALIRIEEKIDKHMNK